MENYFKEEHLTEIKKQRTKTLIIYFVVLAIYLAFCASNLVIFIFQPYGSKYLTLIKIVNGVGTAIFIVFSFIYLAIPFKRVNKYYKMCISLLTGLQTTSVCHFVENTDELTEKDGVDMKSITLLEWSEKKKDYFERKVLVFYDRPFPEIPEKAKLKIITVGNLLLKYEIIQEGEE